MFKKDISLMVNKSRYVLLMLIFYSGFCLSTTPAMNVRAAPLPGRPVVDSINPEGMLALQNRFRDKLDPLELRLKNTKQSLQSNAPMVYGDGHWDGIFGLSGVNGMVYTLAMDGSGNLYAGGEFITAEGLVVNHVSMWDGSSWSSLNSGMNKRVNTLLLNGNDNLYAGGDFTDASGVSVNRIAVWDGTTWSPLGDGMNGSVRALAMDGDGNLYAGGSFTTSGTLTVNRIAMWDGSAWSTLGTGMSGTVRALAFDGDGNLVAGGDFDTAGGVAANRVAVWDGSSWSALGEGMNNQVHSLAVDSSGNLYAGGIFTLAEGVNADHIAMWDGSIWTELGGGTNNTVRGLLVDDSDNLYIVGDFTNAGGVSTSKIAVWDGSTWSALGGGLNKWAQGLVLDGSGNLYVGGDFTLASGSVAYHVARWDGNNWEKVGNGAGLNNKVNALALNSSGNLYAGGTFIYAGDVNANRIAMWDGTDWSILWGGMNNDVRALSIDDGDNLYVGGSFTNAGGVNANRIAYWNGSSWSAVGSGTNNSVRTLVVDGSGNLYAGGDFTVAGDSTVNYVAKWDGSTWSALGSGMNGWVGTLVFDGEGKLYAGGNFTTAGGNPANRVAVWDGSTWSALGDGMSHSVRVLAYAPNGDLYAGGDFISAGGVAASRIARWDGDQWYPLGEGMNNRILGLAIDSNDDVYAGGEFTIAGGNSASYITRWDGKNWSPMGSGMDKKVLALLFDSNGDLYAGGEFNTAGDKGSANLARWFNDPPDALDDEFTTPEETTLVVPPPGVLENDIDINDDILVATLDSPPQVGELTFSNDGSFVYTPTVSYNGAVTITYTITDGYGGMDSAMSTINILEVNDPPVAVDDYAIIDEDETVLLDVLANDTDIDNDPLSISEVTTPTHGIAVISDTIQVLYTPDENYFGTDVFTYTVSDSALIDTAIISLTIASINDAPVAWIDAYETNEDVILSVSAPGVLGNDTDAENTPLTAFLDSSPSYGDLAFSSSGSFVYTPTLNYHGADSFTYHANDGELDSEITTVTINMVSINDNPVAGDDSYGTDEDAPLSVSAPGVLGNDSDVDDDELISALLSGPSNGVLTLYTDGSFLYTPESNYFGSDVFTYTVTDINSGTDTATAFISISSVNDEPVVFAGDDQLSEEGQVVSFEGSYYDPDDPTLFLDSEGVSWDFGDGNTIGDTFTPTHTFTDNGVYTVILSVTDTEGVAGHDTCLITVTNVAPALEPLADQMVNLGEVYTLEAAFSDPGDSDSYSVNIEWEQGVTETLALEAGASEFSASHLYGEEGTYTIGINLMDDDSGMDQGSFRLYVNPNGNMVFLPLISH